MSHSHPSTILLPFTLEAHNTYQDLITNPANWHLFHLSPAFGRGALRSGGFYGQLTQNQNYGHFTGSMDQLAHPAPPLEHLPQVNQHADLVYQHIPFGAVVATVPLPTFLDALLCWCDDVITQIQPGDLRSTEEVARALASAAADPANNTQAAEDVLQLLAVTQSVQLLRHTLPASMLTFDAHTHADAVDAIARLALVFVWWTKWITEVDPIAYPALLQSACSAVSWQLQVLRASALMQVT
ncbi:hypothetical protein B0H17DRAFT_1130843 [Mycena rosella]|uniref:Uncharacterized protein n=1 Tax=Mycena rosella TaxID=1033263 RepID=A0AAD7GIE8_MYCRO|nr:hypothetical protein B0H17DRAFT_1130843 [Mycena rosella]